MTIRTFPDPKVRALERELAAARIELGAAERKEAERITDRRLQREAEEKIRFRGDEPYYFPREPGLHDQHDRTVNGLRTVYRWASDEELAEALAAREATQVEFDRIEAAFEKAMAKAKPLVESEQIAKASKLGGYLAMREIQLAGKWYSPGQVVGPEAVEDIDWPKLSRMLGARNPVLRKV